jgi:zinc transporter ZupT
VILFTILTAFSTFLHEVPHEIGDFGVLLKMGWSKTKVVVVNMLSALITVIGSFSVLFFAENQQLIGSLMAVAAGIFLYLGTIDFLPQTMRSETKDKNAFVSLLPLLFGILTMVIALNVIPHQHEESAIDHEGESAQVELFETH